MSRFSVTLDTDGPQTREDLCDALKAYIVLTGREARFIYVPLSTYKKWTEWSADEKGTHEQSGPPNMDAVPKQFMGCTLYIGEKFSLS